MKLYGMDSFKKSLIPVFILVLFFSSCSDKRKQEEAMLTYQKMSDRLLEYQKDITANSSALTALGDECDVLLKDVFDPKKRGLVYSLKGAAIGSTGKLTEAESAFAEALKLNPDNYIIYKRFGRMYFLNKKWENSEPQITSALNHGAKSIKPDERIELLYYKAKILDELGKYNQAEDNYRKLVEYGDSNDITGEYYNSAMERIIELERE